MKKLIFIILLLSANYCLSQDYRFGKISEKELSEKINKNDTTADATILFRSEEVFFRFHKDHGFLKIRSVHQRVKIYNQAGVDWATEKIRLYDKNNAESEDVKTLKGFTYNIVNGKIEKDKLRNENIFKEDINKYWKQVSFTMPNIQNGSVIEYSYEIESPFLSIDDINFQYSIPIKKFNLRIKAPEYFIYKTTLNPMASYVPQLNRSVEQGSANYTSKTREGVYKSETSFSNNSIEFKENVIEVAEDDIPALHPEPMVDNVSNYAAKLIMELTATKFPNQAINTYSTTWESVTKTINSDADFGNQIARSNYYQNDLDALLNGKNTEVAKLLTILQFVKSKVRWNGFLGYSSENGTRKAYLDGTGNVADINLMLISMLRYAGIESHPVLVSTKDNGIPLYPTLKGFNYVVCMFKIDGKEGLLDATDIYANLNILPNRALNWQGRLILDDGSSTWVSMLPNFKSKNFHQLSVEFDENFHVSGRLRNTLSNYFAHQHREGFNNIHPEDYSKLLEKQMNNFEVRDLSISNIDQLSKPVGVTYSFSNNVGIDNVGDKLIFAPVMFLNEIDDSFLQDERKYPLDFVFPFERDYIINYKLPEGYEIASVPDDIKYVYQNGEVSYNYLLKANPGSIQLRVTLDCNVSYVNPDNYQFLKEFYGLVKDKQSEQIVLQKI